MIVYNKLHYNYTLYFPQRFIFTVRFAKSFGIP